MADKIVVGLYGLLMIAGAFFGLKAGSKISLIMGLVSGALVFAGYYLMLSNVKQGFLVLSIIGGVLAVAFLMRYLKTMKIMPAGMLLAVTAVFLIFCLWRYLKS